MGALIFGVGGVDWQERIDFPRMRKERLARAQEKLKEKGLAVALLADENNVRYCTGAKGPPIPLVRYALVFAEHDPIVYELGEVLEQNKVNAPWIKPENWRLANLWEGGRAGLAVVEEETKQFAKDIKKELAAKGLAKERLGVDMMDGFGKKALADAGIETVEAMPIMVEARKIKTKDEVNCIKMTANMTVKALSRMYDTLKVGITECELSAEGTAVLIRAGADVPTVLAGVTSGPRCFEMGHLPNTDRMIEYGDTLYVQFCGTPYNGYRICIYRSFIVGREPNAKEKEWNKKCYDRVYGAINAIKPGATTADVAKHLGDPKEWGYKDVRALRGAEVAHGIGLSTHEYPFIVKPWSIDHPLVLEEGMVLAVECREGEPYVGGVRIEEMVVVTKNGYEIISGSWPCKELVAAHVI